VVVNKLGDRDILTIKGAAVMETNVYPDSNIPDIVKQIRETLDGIAFDANRLYRFFGSPQMRDALCREAVAKLASAGWNLFNTIAPSPELKEKIQGLLAQEGKTILIAPILRDKVVPWAFVYDRRYDDEAKQIGGVTVDRGTCLAAVPSPGCPFQTSKCGEPADCLLNPALQAERKAKGLAPYHEDTVACPLRFWGFRHILEVPPRQVEEENDHPKNEPAAIHSTGTFELVAGLNAKLALCAEHWKELSQLATWNSPEYGRDEILDLLRNKQPDIIYFFCHARGGQLDAAKTYPPYLQFQKATASEPGKVRPQDFGDKPVWSHAPLVFLNACGTLGYSPDALSPFLKALVDGRNASGVLGTEVAVAEALARDFAREFIGRFLSGAKAGRAVLDARRALLTERNPLGLVYTLFASADLTIQ
jgi:hypothetical protein